MGIGLVHQNQYAIGLLPNIKLNNYNDRVNFGRSSVKDEFHSNSPLRFFDENSIRKMIAQNPEIKNILSRNKIPLNLNIKELEELKLNHCKDTQEISENIAKNLPAALKFRVNMKNLKDGAMLHDFGKVLVPTEILNKEGVLSAKEREIMDLHSELGYQLLKNSGVNDDVLKLVRYHHGNVDKSNAKDLITDINLQILHLADKYSALTERRVYKEPFSPKKALTILYQDVKSGEIHPILFQALVKSVSPEQVKVNVKNA